MSRYSLWIMPSGQVYNSLLDLISQLSTRYHTPPFEPHVTLLGSLTLPEAEMVSKTKRLAGLIKSLTVTLHTPDWSDEYFRCLFVNVQKTDELLEANRSAGAIFDAGHDSGFRPHLSLIYGDLSADIKETIVERLGGGCDMQFQAGSVHLTTASSDTEPSCWCRLREFSLG